MGRSCEAPTARTKVRWNAADSRLPFDERARVVHVCVYVHLLSAADGLEPFPVCGAEYRLRVLTYSERVIEVER